jgi:hypothetical protein
MILKMKIILSLLKLWDNSGSQMVQELLVGEVMYDDTKKWLVVVRIRNYEMVAYGIEN